MKLFLFLILPTMVTCNTVDVQFSGTIDFERSQVRGVFDATKHPSFDGKTYTNNINILKHAIELYNGKMPDEVYVTSPENQGDFYKENGLQDVRRRIVPTNVNAIQVKTKNILATKKPFFNYEEKSEKTVIDVSLMVQHKISSDWNVGGDSFDDKVHLDLKFRVNCGKTEIDNTFDWGYKRVARITDLLQEKEETVIAPGEEIIAELHAKLGLVQFAIDYNVSVTGDVVGVYNDMYNGKRYHMFNIVDLLGIKGINTSHIATQIVSYQFYYGPFLKIVDSYTHLSEKNKKKQSGTPMTDTKHKGENTEPKVEGLGKIKMTSPSKVVNYIFEDIGKDMYTGLNEHENSREQSESKNSNEQSDSSEESVK